METAVWNESLASEVLLGDRVNAGGGCDAAVTARTRCRWVNVPECGELLY